MVRSFALTEHKSRLGHFVPGLAMRFLQEIEDSPPARQPDQPTLIYTFSKMQL
ncbi:hypothetical protein JOE21_000970 [Desmospora profundinema]|uniref:Uncharacterized protein n=1 Tax=Desmospora profundinema TaxID=1571184 RepID=A0ABU1ILE6_9BACL|nr:hypothetical protein [Desmospora profundinema]